MISTFIMCILRKFGWSRGACFAMVFWFFSLFCMLYILNYDSKAYIVMLKHLSRTTGQLKSLRKEYTALKSLFDKCYFRRISTPIKKLNLRPNVVPAKGGNVRPPEVLKTSLAPPIIVMPSVEYETLRRKLYSDVQEFWWFISKEVKRIIKENRKSIPNLSELFDNLLSLGAEHKRTILKDVSTISVLDGYENWRLQEIVAISNLVQWHIQKLQNPADCPRTKKFVCSLVKTCCYACLLHHLTYCLIMAFGHGRTLVIKQGDEQHGISDWKSIFQPISDTCLSFDSPKTDLKEDPLQPSVIDLPPIKSRPEQPDFLPGTIPKDFASRLVRVHSNPEIWWTGQFLKYLMKYQPSIEHALNKFANETDFYHPVVGVHIHRPTRFDSTGTFHSIKEYMSEVEDYFMQLNLSYPVPQKTIYLATNDLDLFEEIEEKYPEYNILGDGNFSLYTVQENQCNSFALNAVLTNVHFLARSDFLVCAFSSEVCRLAYEIMNSLVPDAYNRFRSVDKDYYFEGQIPEQRIVTHLHTPRNPEELPLSTGTVLLHEGNMWNGYSRGSLMEQSISGLYPSFKAVKIVNVVDYPMSRPRPFPLLKIT